MDLQTTIAGLLLKNPLMPASGPLTGDADKMLAMAEMGVGAMVTKTISTKAAVVSRPCIVGVGQTVFNTELWSEYGPEIWLQEYLPKLPIGLPRIVSCGYTAEDMAQLIPQLNAYADAFEISTHYVGTNLDDIARTVRTIRSLTDKPIFMKLSPHAPDPERFAEMVLQNGGTGIVAINSLGPCMTIDAAAREVRIGTGKGQSWASGPAIKPLALAMVQRLRLAQPNMPIIGVGGIRTAEDIIEFLLAGADAVQMLSSALLYGKDLYAKIIEDLPKALIRCGFDSIQAIKETTLAMKSDSGEHRFPVIDHVKCTRCGLCERVCPWFSMKCDPIVAADSNCFSCGLCESRCPVHAIKLM